MAKAKFNFPLRGSMGNYSIYQMAGCKHLVLRSKGGPTKDQIETGSQFSRLRDNIQEFSAVVKLQDLLIPLSSVLNHCQMQILSAN